MEQQNKKQYTLNDFLPLLVMFTLIAAINVAYQLYFGWCPHSLMRITMASFFLIFGAFKVINLAGFAKAYAIYDLLAQRIFAYGYVYPFIEIGLGLAYLFKYQLYYVNIITLVVMVFSAAGVFNELRKGKQIMCACLGVLFKIPMTYVTLLEDLAMAAMAGVMLFKN